MSGLFWKMRLMSLHPHLFKKTKVIEDDSGEKSLITPKFSYNPLMNELILQNTLVHLTRKDLLKCRLVCQLWNNEVIIVCRRMNHMKVLKTTESLRKTNRVLKRAALVSVNSLHVRIQEMTKPEFDFLQCSAIQNSIVYLEVVIVSHLVPTILTSLVNFSSLKTLIVTRIPEDSIESMFMARIIRTTELTALSHKSKLQNLEHVTFQNSVPAKKLLGNYNHFISAFLRCVPNLKILEFNSWPIMFLPGFCNFDFTNLQGFSIRGKSLGHDELTYLILKTLPQIRRLEITVSPTVSPQLVTQLLQANKDSLKSYKITHKRHEV